MPWICGAYKEQGGAIGAGDKLRPCGVTGKALRLEKKIHIQPTENIPCAKKMITMNDLFE